MKQQFPIDIELAKKEENHINHKFRGPLYCQILTTEQNFFC